MEGKKQRVEYLTSLLYELDPEGFYDETYRIKNATLDSICQYPGPGYMRVKSWLENKTLKKRGEENQSNNNDMELAREQLQKCFELMQSRNKSYGSSWKCLSIQSIANLIEMKMNRIAKLGEIDAKTQDEFQDCLNYACFGLIKINNKKGGIKE